MADNVSTVQCASRRVTQEALVLEFFQNVLVNNGTMTPCLLYIGHGQGHPGLDAVPPLQEVVHTQLDAFAGKHFVVAMAARRNGSKSHMCIFAMIFVVVNLINC